VDRLVAGDRQCIASGHGRELAQTRSQRDVGKGVRLSRHFR
jgi:hypothetical protein